MTNQRTGVNLSFKYCSKCKETKELQDFNKNIRQKFGRSNYCRPCGRTYSQNWTTPEKLAQKYRARRLPERARKHKSSWLLKKYGITIEQYEFIWENQGKCCKICRTIENSKGKSFAVDHCHVTLKVRGILCDNCNQLLGKAKDDYKILENAIEYLKSNLVVD